MSEALDNDIINLDDVRRKIEMKKRTDILAAHKYAITYGKDGYWKTYVPDSTKKTGRKLLKKNTKEKLEQAIILHYKKQTDTGTLTLETLYPKWLKYYSLHTNSSSTVKRITSDWNKYYKNDNLIKQPIKSLSKIVLDEWIHNVIKQYDMKKTCYYNMSLILRQMMKYALECQYILTNPFEEVKVNSKLFSKKKKASSETQVYNLEEELLIIKEAWSEYQSNPSDTTPLAVILLFYLGTRVGELVAFKDIDITPDGIKVQRMEERSFTETDSITYHQCGRNVVERAKSSAGCRTIPLIEDTRMLLNLILKINHAKGYTHDFFLFTRDGKRIPDTAIRWRLEKYCNHIGIKYRSPHKARKTYISKLIAENININTIREIVGHEDERTTYKNYCYDINPIDQTKIHLEKTLKIDMDYGFKNNVVNFENKIDIQKVFKGIQNITA